MARMIRRWYRGAIYHVVNRGNRKAEIFQDKGDRIFFLEQLKEAQLEYPFSVHALCLMPNHFHLELETESTELGRIMKKLQSQYAIFYNRKYGYSGHVFGGRYKAKLIEDERYFLEAGRYIHLNPVKAMIVRDPSEYEFSSYRLYMHEEKDDRNDKALRLISDIVDTKRVLAAFDGDRERYKQFVEDKMPHEEHEQLIMKDMHEDEMWEPK